MVNINISIKEEAYNYLKMLKGNDKSFSDVILGMKNERKGCTGKELVKLAERFKDLNIDWDKKQREAENIRKELNEELNERVERVRKRMNDRN